MKRILICAFITLTLAVSARAELRQVEMKVFGMD